MRRRITPLLTICLLIVFATLPVIPFCLAAELTDEEKAVLEDDAKKKAELKAQAEGEP